MRALEAWTIVHLKENCNIFNNFLCCKTTLIVSNAKHLVVFKINVNQEKLVSYGKLCEENNGNLQKSRFPLSFLLMQPMQCAMTTLANAKYF